MKFLERERIAFEQTKHEFWLHYGDMITQMQELAAERGERLDMDTPLHHRMEPSALCHEVLKKGRRTRSMVGQEGWEDSEELLLKTIEECTDIANFALYLAATTHLFLCELRTRQAEEEALQAQSGERDGVARRPRIRKEV